MFNFFRNLSKIFDFFFQNFVKQALVGLGTMRGRLLSKRKKMHALKFCPNVCSKVLPSQASPRALGSGLFDAPSRNWDQKRAVAYEFERTAACKDAEAFAAGVADWYELELKSSIAEGPNQSNF